MLMNVLPTMVAAVTSAPTQGDRSTAAADQVMSLPQIPDPVQARREVILLFAAVYTLVFVHVCDGTTSVRGP